MFKDEKYFLWIIDKIVLVVGCCVDEFNFYVDVCFGDGLCFNVMVGLIVVDGLLVLIWKFKKDKLGISDFVNFGVFIDEMVVYFEVVVLICLNVIVLGGMGLGKIIMLNVLLLFIDDSECILMIEDMVEF